MSIPGNKATGGIRGTIVKSLTTISHVTSPFISVFLLVHLSAPVLANFGGTSLASQTMVREIFIIYLFERKIKLVFVTGVGERVLSK